MSKGAKTHAAREINASLLVLAKPSASGRLSICNVLYMNGAAETIQFSLDLYGAISSCRSGRRYAVNPQTSNTSFRQLLNGRQCRKHFPRVVRSSCYCGFSRETRLERGAGLQQNRRFRSAIGRIRQGCTLEPRQHSITRVLIKVNETE